MSPFIIGFFILVAAGGGFWFGNLAGHERAATRGELGELNTKIKSLESAKTKAEKTASDERAERIRQTSELSRQLSDEGDKRRVDSNLANAMASDVLAIHRIIASDSDQETMKRLILDVITKREYER